MTIMMPSFAISPQDITPVSPPSIVLSLSSMNNQRVKVTQPYDAFLVLDVEATCLQGTDFQWPNEIIVRYRAFDPFFPFTRVTGMARLSPQVGR
jgi:hypothetical protein